MVELSKGLKIILIVDIVVAIYYGVLYLLLPELYYQMSDGPAFVHLWRLFGVTIFILVIAGIIALKRGEWEGISLILLIIFSYSIMNIK